MRKVFLEEVEYKTYHGHGIDWKSLVGKTVNFTYDNISGQLYIKEYMTTNQHILVTYNGVDIPTKRESLLYGHLGSIVRNIFAQNKPDIIELIQNPFNEIKALTICSEKFVTVKCPRCGELKEIQVRQLFKENTIACNRCSDGRSYPEKFLYNVLYQLGIDFIYQYYVPNDKNGIRYDFYIPDRNMIIEVDGIQHLIESNKWHDGSNDEYKNNVANDLGVNLIRVNCLKSKKEYITESIKQALSIYFDLNNIDWVKCHEFACKSLIVEIGNSYSNGEKNLNNLAKTFHIHRKTVIDHLRKATEIGLCDFNIETLYQQRKDNSIRAVRERCQKAIRVYLNGILCGEFESVTILCNLSMKFFGVQFDRRHVGEIANHKYGRKSHFGYTFEWVFQ